MDFLKSAVASAISRASAFGYAFGDRVDVDASHWALYNGTKRVRRPRATRTALPVLSLSVADVIASV